MTFNAVRLEKPGHCIEIRLPNGDPCRPAISIAKPCAKNVWIDWKLDVRKLQGAGDRDGKSCGAIMKMNATLDHLRGRERLLPPATVSRSTRRRAVASLPNQ